MPIQERWAASEIVAFVDTTFTLTGVSGKVDDAGRCVLVLPPTYPDLTRLIAALEDEFDAVCDITSVSTAEVTLTVWPRYRESTPESKTKWPSTWVIASIVAGVCSSAGMAMLTWTYAV